MLKNCKQSCNSCDTGKHSETIQGTQTNFVCVCFFCFLFLLIPHFRYNNSSSIESSGGTSSQVGVYIKVNYSQL